MEMKAGLTFACMNLKKLAKMIAKSGRNTSEHLGIKWIFIQSNHKIEKWCWS
jgi:hypothetical protein